MVRLGGWAHRHDLFGREEGLAAIMVSHFDARELAILYQAVEGAVARFERKAQLAVGVALSQQEGKGYVSSVVRAVGRV